MISLKEYAAKNKISYEAVRKQVVRYKKELGPHLVKVDKTQYLDDEGETFLNERRSKNPVVVEQKDKNEQIEELEKQIKILLSEKSMLESKVTALTEWKAEKAELIAEAKYQKLQLEDKSKQLQEAKKEADEYHFKNQQLQKELDDERTRKLSLREAWKRIMGN